jgi:hypothetical protein
VPALRNGCASAEFRLLLAPRIGAIARVLSARVENVEFYVQLTGLLVGAMDAFPDGPGLVCNCFRILAQISTRDSVRRDLLGQYSATGLLVRLLRSNRKLWRQPGN